MKQLRLLITFYKPIALTSYILTAICLYTLYTQGLSSFQPLFWFKIFTLGLFVYYINNYKRQEYYYYKNLGFSKLKLWIPILIFDFSVFLISMIIIALKIHETQIGS